MRGYVKNKLKQTPMQARRISYLRCAAYFRPLPRTRQQQNHLLAQTHSRGRTMLASITEISLPPCIGVLFPTCSTYTTAPRATYILTDFHNVNRENEESCQEKRFSGNWFSQGFARTGTDQLLSEVGVSAMKPQWNEGSERLAFWQDSSFSYYI